jgi:hypothetical protein
MRSVRRPRLHLPSESSTNFFPLCVVNIGQTPQYTPLFEDLARYTCNLLARNASTSLPPAPASDGPAAKKRKLQNGDTTNGATAEAPVDLKGDAPVQFYVQDISFAAPQRKKLTLEITAGSRYLRARNQTTKEVEFGVPMNQIRETAIAIYI